MQKFEDFLMEKHAEQFIGTKDVMVDDFEKWLSEQDIDSFLIFGDLFARKQVKELLEVCKKLTGFCGNEAFDRVVKEAQEVIKKLERR